jgi:hypothetical protein
VRGPAGDLGLLHEIVGVGHERQSQRTRKPDHLGGVHPIESEIVDHHCEERQIVARRRRNGETYPCRPRVVSQVVKKPGCASKIVVPAKAGAQGK